MPSRRCTGRCHNGGAGGCWALLAAPCGGQRCRHARLLAVQTSAPSGIAVAPLRTETRRPEMVPEEGWGRAGSRGHTRKELATPFTSSRDHKGANPGGTSRPSPAPCALPCASPAPPLHPAPSLARQSAHAPWGRSHQTPPRKRPVAPDEDRRRAHASPRVGSLAALVAVPQRGRRRPKPPEGGGAAR